MWWGFDILTSSSFASSPSFHKTCELKAICWQFQTNIYSLSSKILSNLFLTSKKKTPISKYSYYILQVIGKRGALKFGMQIQLEIPCEPLKFDFVHSIQKYSNTLKGSKIWRKVCMTNKKKFTPLPRHFCQHRFPLRKRGGEKKWGKYCESVVIRLQKEGTIWVMF